jgi:ribosome-binding factor A
MPGFMPGIPLRDALRPHHRDGRDKPGHDARNRWTVMAQRKKSNQREPASAGPSQRALRVGELIRHALAEMLSRGDIHDPTIESHLITVPEVRMSPDLKLATVYVMPLGGKDVAAVVKALDANKRYLRGEIAHRVNLKFAPDLRFRADERFDEAERIEKLLRTPAVRRDVEGGGEDE